jgi:arylsulfatase A-like enzyme
VILLDDMGYGDIAAHGNPVIRTPHLDRLRDESVRLTNFHVDPTCAPTRSALMTGKYSHHVKVWHTIAAGNHLRATELTMADAFRANGYRTGMFGKWHLGANFPYRPMDRGFDEWLGQGDGGTGTTDDHFLNDRVNDH